MSFIPKMPRGVRLHQDKVRGVPVLLGPERALILDEIGIAILGELDGSRSFHEIVARLAAAYAAPAEEIATDVRAFLDDLQGQRLIDYGSVEVSHG